MMNWLLAEKELPEGYHITTDKSKIDMALVYQYLCVESYWAKGIPQNLLQTAMDHSLCFSILFQDKQVGFARLITDYSTFGYLADVFIMPEHRGRGLSKKLMDFILSLDMIKNFRRILLATKDAHGLYAQFGFAPLHDPDRFMQIHHQDVYESLL